MSEPTKCCGNCRWWWQNSETAYGLCKYPTPKWAWTSNVVRVNEYHNCPCFALPIPQEVAEAVKLFRERGSYTPYEPMRILSQYVIENIPQLKGSQ